MGWVLTKERKPEHEATYFVVEFIEGTKGSGFFNPISPCKKITLMSYQTLMKIESNYSDRVIYKKYKAFKNQYDLEQKEENILYWYELDPIPEEEIPND